MPDFRALALLFFSLIVGFPSTTYARDKLAFPPFGEIHVVRPAGEIQSVVLFASGDGGWNGGVINIANAVSSTGALVIGFDIRHYVRSIGRNGCLMLAVDFENLSHFIQKKLDLPAYKRPVLLGYSSGATLVYATLAQSPPGTFDAAVSLGFCPDIKLPQFACPLGSVHSHHGKKPGEFIFDPAPAMEDAWIVMQGDEDKECLPAATKDFTEKIPAAKFVELENVGHGFKVSNNWVPQFKRAIDDVIHPDRRIAREIANLSLIEVPPANETDALAILFTGDGGWAGIDKALAAELSKHGFHVLGFDSLDYFWKRRTPEELSRALREILERYQKPRVLVLGYSFGADVIPFAVSRLPNELKSSIQEIALLAPDDSAEFEFHMIDWVGWEGQTAYKVVPEIARLDGVRVLCLYGQSDSSSICKNIRAQAVTSRQLPGGHHFSGDYEALAKVILAAFEQN